MFLTFGSQHARQSPQLLSCFGAGQVAAVVTKEATCPAPKQLDKNGKPHCKDCRACWDPKVKNIAYGEH